MCTIPCSPDPLPGPPAPEQPAPKKHARQLLLRIVAAIMIIVLVIATAGWGLLALAAPAPAKAATMIIPGPPPADPAPQIPAHIHTAVVGGMPGWQIALIAASSAVLAAILAVAADRVRAMRRHVPAPSL